MASCGNSEMNEGADIWTDSGSWCFFYYGLGEKQLIVSANGGLLRWNIYNTLY